MLVAGTPNPSADDDINIPEGLIGPPFEARVNGSRDEVESPPKEFGTLAALSILERAGIAHKILGYNLVEVDGKFILHAASGYWREHDGTRCGYSVRDLTTLIKTPALA
jgi:hypothetical protein